MRSNLRLSGGYDSRLVLCLALAGLKEPPEWLRLTSREQQEDDFRVAQSLARRLGLPLNGKRPASFRTFAETDTIRMYMLAAGATYLPFNPVYAHRYAPAVELQLTGDQPTAWDYFAGGGQFHGAPLEIANDIEKALAERPQGARVAQDFLESFDDLGVERDHPAAMLAYYAAIRSRHHCGRQWSRAKGVEMMFTPLKNSQFVALDRRNRENGLGPHQFFVDAFSASSDWALDEPFETPDRAFDPALIAASPFAGGVTITPRRFRVFGAPSGDGETADFFSVGLEVGARPETIKPILHVMFGRASRARAATDLFANSDFAKARLEIAADGPLSHGRRKLRHIVATDAVLRIVEQSGG